MATYKKLTINVHPDFHAEIAKMAEERGISITELFKRAIALDKYVWEHRDAELLIREGDQVKQIVLM